MDKECSGGPGRLFSSQQGGQAPAVDGTGAFGAALDPAELCKCREDVNVRAQGVEVAASVKAARRPVDKERHAVAAIVAGAFLASHSRVEAWPGLRGVAGSLFPTASSRGASRGPVIGHEDEDGVFGELELIEALDELSHVVIDIGDHSIEGRHASRDPFLPVWSLVAFRYEEGAVRSIGAQVGEEGSVSVFFDEGERFFEPDIGAIPLGLFRLSITEIGVVKIIISEEVRRLADPSAAMIEGLLEPLVLRSAGVIVAKMPLAVHPGGVAVRLEDFSKGPLLSLHDRSAHDGVPDSCAG